MSIAYNEKLTDYGIKPSTGTVGDSYDNALAETVNGLYKSELIYSQSWASLMDVEFATLNRAHWYNTQRLHKAIDYHTPTEIKQIYYAKRATNTPEPIATT